VRNNTRRITLRGAASFLAVVVRQAGQNFFADKFWCFKEHRCPTGLALAIAQQPGESEKEFMQRVASRCKKKGLNDVCGIDYE
jgi:hypothetical protein